MNEELISKYFKMLHPDMDALTPGEQLKLMEDRDFIAENIDEIDSYYQDCKKPGTYAYEKGLDDQEIISMAVKDKKVDRYFEMLHPDMDTLTPGEKFRLMKDKDFIAENIDEIDSYYQDCKKPGTYAYEKGLDDQEIISMAVKDKKVDRYFEMLHPDMDTLTPGEKFRLMKDKDFIAENIDEIDIFYQNAILSNNRDEEYSSKEILQSALDNARQEKTSITPSDIEQSTQNVRVDSFRKATKNIKESAKEIQELSNEEQKKIKDGISLDD